VLWLGPRRLLCLLRLRRLPLLWLGRGDSFAAAVAELAVVVVGPRRLLCLLRLRCLPLLWLGPRRLLCLLLLRRLPLLWLGPRRLLCLLLLRRLPLLWLGPWRDCFDCCGCWAGLACCLLSCFGWSLSPDGRSCPAQAGTTNPISRIAMVVQVIRDAFIC